MQSKFFPFYLTRATKIYVATSHSVARLETIEISEQRTAFIWIFAQEVDWCIKDCDKEHLQTTALINVWKIFPGYTGDWLDVNTASTCTTELWDPLKSFILDSLKIKVAPHPIIVSLDTLRRVLFVLNAPLRRVIFKLSFRHSVERLRIFLSPHLKKKKMNTATKDPPQSELEPRTPRSRILSLSTWAICDSTKAGGKKTLKYGRAHSASRAAASDLVVDLAVLLFADGSLSFVFFERPG